MAWGLPHTAEEVADVLEKTAMTFIYHDESGSLEEIEFFANRLYELIDLRDTLVASEMALFQYLNITCGTPLEGLRILQNRITTIEMANNRFSAEAIKDALLGDLQVINLLDNITTDAVGAAIEQIDWTFDQVAGINDDDLTAAIINQFNNILSQNTKLSSGYFVNLPGKINDAGKILSPQGLQRILSVTRPDKDRPNVFHISVNEGEPISAEIRDKLLKVMNIYTNQQLASNTTQASFRQLIYNKLYKYIQQYNIDGSLLADCLLYELQNNFGANNSSNSLYDLSRSFSSLVGFIQEIWTNALLSALIGSPGQSMPTGNIRNALLNHQEIGVDAVLKDFNFQIKSYKLEDGQKYELIDSTQAGSLIDRMQMQASDVLLAFFGSYQFNQPFKTVKTTSNLMSVAEYAERIYSNFLNIYPSLEKVFQAHVDRIIRIDNTFKADRGQLFQNEKLYFNTMFIINDSIIPASAMVQAIIDAIQSVQQKEVLRFHLGKMETSNSPTLEEVIKNGDKTDQPHKYEETRYTGELKKVANAVRISYTINLNFAEILDRAYSFIKGG